MGNRCERCWTSRPRPLEAHLAPLDVVVSAARAMAIDGNESLDHRLMAIDVLGLVDSYSGKILLDLLEPRHAEELQWAAARSLAEPDRETAERCSPAGRT